jgi:hypothetical protein
VAIFTLVPSAQRRAIQSDQLSIASALKGNQMTLVMATAVDMICPDMKNSGHATGDNIGTRTD